MSELQLGGVFMIVLALVFVPAGIVTLYRSRWMQRHGIRTTATVADYVVKHTSRRRNRHRSRGRRGGAGRTRTSYRPVLDFIGPNGMPVRVTSASSRTIRPVEPGGSVEIIHHPTRPDRRAVLADDAAGPGWLLVGLGLVQAMIGVVLWLLG